MRGHRATKSFGVKGLNLIKIGARTTGISDQSTRKVVLRGAVATIPTKIAAVENRVQPTILPDEVLKNLTGKMLTARAIGNKTLCSAQEINKRIVAAGLATKLPGGGYSLTATGKLLGKGVIKTNRYGHTFDNIEWDEKIIDVIFNAAERLDITNRWQRINEIRKSWS